MLYSVLLAVHVIITLLLVGIIIIQRSDSDGMGLTGSASPMMSTRSSANFLTRTTAILAAAFILSSLSLSIVHQKSTGASIVDQISEEAPVSATPEAPAEEPATPTVPLRE